MQFTGFGCRMGATVNVGFPIRWAVFAHNTTLDEQLFPGLIYRLLEPKTVIPTFVSDLVLTGARSVAQLHEAFARCIPC